MDSDDDFICDDGDMYDSGNEDCSEDDEEDSWIMDTEFEKEPSGSSNKSIEEKYQFEVLSTENIVSHMSEIIKEVSSITNLPSTTVRILLSHFKWDKDKLIERYYTGDQEAMFQEAHVISPDKIRKTAESLRSQSPSSSGTVSALDCDICCLSLPRQMMTGLECGHLFCNQCWTEYLTTKIMDEGASQMIECPGACNIVVNDQTVMTLITDPRVKLKYQHLITNSFVQCNKLLKWCPSPDCSKAVKVQDVEAKPVKCQCNHSFCFSCSEDLHDPVTCILLKKWIKKCDDDSETSNWICAHTKDCPKCGTAIEKNGGCNHMNCRNESCQASFCWVCLGDWRDHANYKCNQYVPDEAKTSRDNSRAALEKYLFYYTRYANHLQSLKLENKLYDTVKEKMRELQQNKMSWIEVQFLMKSVDVLSDCRRTLMYTYAFSFYLMKNNQTSIFEDNQNDLEVATEQLSEFLERDLGTEDSGDFGEKVKNKYNYCESRRKVLLAHVREGYDNDTWLYNDNYY